MCLAAKPSTATVLNVGCVASIARVCLLLSMHLTTKYLFFFCLSSTYGPCLHRKVLFVLCILLHMLHCTQSRNIYVSAKVHKCRLTDPSTVKSLSYSGLTVLGVDVNLQLQPSALTYMLLNRGAVVSREAVI